METILENKEIFQSLGEALVEFIEANIHGKDIK